jgi:peptidoglycan/LPS O-acetylase OafA/YrhL
MTNSGHFIPEIDGLRFVAIAPVLLDHAFWSFNENVYPVEDTLGGPLQRMFSSGELGVQLFYLICGMCYTIYLIHYPLLSFFSKIWAATIDGNFAVFLAVAMCVVLASSALFFAVLERPFMNQTALNALLRKDPKLKG